MLTWDSVKKLFRSLLSTFIPTIVPEGTMEANLYAGYPEMDRKCNAMDPKPLAKLIRRCISLDLTAEVEELRAQIDRTVTATPVIAPLILYLLKFLCAPLDKRLAECKSEVSLFAQSILKLCISKYVGEKPAGEPGWSRRRRGCGCDDCRLLDEFLADPTKEEFSFGPCTHSKVIHLEDLLPKSWGPRDDTGEMCTVKRDSHSLNSVSVLIRKTAMDEAQMIKAWTRRSNKVKSVVEKHSAKAILGDAYDELVDSSVHGRKRKRVSTMT